MVVAHLDTVPVAPGAEDNASGISVLLELARMAAAAPPGDARPVHRLRRRGAAWLRRRPAPLRVPAARRRPVQGGAAGDPGRGRPGPGRRAGVVRAGLLARASGNDLRADVRAAARQVDVPTRACGGNTTSDHWSYVKAGIPGSGWAASRTPATTPPATPRTSSTAASSTGSAP